MLWSFARPHRRTLLGAVILGLFASSSELATPMVTKWVLDTVSGDGGLLAPVLVLAGLLVVGAVIRIWQAIILGTLAEDIVLGARRLLITRFLRAKVIPLLRRPSGELVTRVTSDSVLLREAASSSLVGLVNGVVMLAGTLVLMAVLDLLLFGVTIASVLVVSVLFALLLPGIATAQQRAQKALGDLGSELEETLRAIKTVKVVGAEDQQSEKLDVDARSARDHGVDAVRREAVAWTIAWTGVQGAIIVILAIGAVRVAGGDMEVSTLVAFLLYAFALMGPITELSENMTTLQAGIAAAGRIRETESIEIEDHRRLGPTPAGRGRALSSVRARYSPDDPWAIDGVSLDIPARGHVAVVGPSGAGKTSVMSAILGFLDAEQGTLTVGDQHYHDLSPQQVRARLAYVEQDAPVVPGTIRDNLMFANPHADQRLLAAILDELDLAPLITDLPKGLDTTLSNTSVSGGQRQRIALARALLAEPDLLLLDEATAQVDGITEAAVHRAIKFQARRGAVLTIAHRLSTVVDADQIVVMEHGRISARGTHGQLLDASPLYREMVAALSLGV
ncbi:ABC transporter permease [Dietzia lutea]|uniref:ABC transporter permease n=1 Tax=Dietzia lutea TaxID=546160 RepID=A0A2S1R3T3_9ACTN|nr:ABC transporter permease [Dietzia lutea]